ncbi:hypothetical protein BRC71_02700 [Halobacteriales archaeon QH_7_65_31]|nr:MAG: hypothetical protein BRC71_02700 [Halobacteriales archaeon QH_7_65_31]
MRRLQAAFRLASAVLSIAAVTMVLGQGMPESTFVMRIAVGVLVAAVLQVGYEATEEQSAEA